MPNSSLGMVTNSSSPGLIAANIVTLGLTAAVLVAKLKFDRPTSAIDTANS